MFESIEKYFSDWGVDPVVYNRIENYLKNRYQKNPDPWGLNVDGMLSALKILAPLYDKYFKVRTFGLEKVPDRPMIFVSNHTGQIAFDAMLIALACTLKLEPPRILRSMVDRFLAGMPFLGSLVASTGQVLGDRTNFQYLIKRGESILVFPEGVKGIAKNTQDFYQLQNFTQGFFRMALQGQVDIQPVAVIGAEEFYPWVYHPKKIIKFLKLPALPVTPFFPVLGPLGVPLPSPVDIYFGEPFTLPANLDADADEKLVNKYIKQIESQIKEMIDYGLANRRPFLDKFGFNLKKEL